MLNKVLSQNPRPRRDFLRGLGASIALPALASLPGTRAMAAVASAVQPTATTASGAPLRTAFLYFPNGVIQDAWWPKATGQNYELTRTLKPLESNREYVQVLGGLDQVNAEAGGDGAGDHARGGGVFLTGVRLNKSATKIRAGISIDQVLAKHVGHQTRFSSLELSCEPKRTTGNCDSGYSCAYNFNMSWASAHSPKAPESNPKLLFERMFGSGDPAERINNLERRRQQQRSILDFVLEDAGRVRKTLDSHDKHKLEEYLTSVCAIEARIEKADALGDPASGDLTLPAGIPKDYPEYLTTMLDMLLLAFQTDSTRVATLMLSHDGSNRSFDHIGIPDGHHDLSHHRNDEEKIKKISDIDRWYVEQLNGFLTKLRQQQDLDGNSLLDNSMIVFGCGNSDGNRHSHRNLPILLAGKGGGNLNPGRYVQHASVPMCNLYLGLAEKMGIAHLDRFGDSTGTLSDI